MSLIIVFNNDCNYRGLMLLGRECPRNVCVSQLPRHQQVRAGGITRTHVSEPAIKNYFRSPPVINSADFRTHDALRQLNKHGGGNLNYNNQSKGSINFGGDSIGHRRPVRFRVAPQQMTSSEPGARLAIVALKVEVNQQM